MLLLFLGWWWVSICLQIIYNICEEDRNFSRSRYRAPNTRVRLWVGAESVPFKLYRGIFFYCFLVGHVCWCSGKSTSMSRTFLLLLGQTTTDDDQIRREIPGIHWHWNWMALKGRNETTTRLEFFLLYLGGSCNEVATPNRLLRISNNGISVHWEFIGFSLKRISR